MRWYTREWATGQVSDADSDLAKGEYKSHLIGLLSDLSGPLLSMATADPHHSLDDARIREFDLDEARRRIGIQLTQGNLDVGYGGLSLDLQNAQLVGTGGPELKAILADPQTEVWYWELDRAQDTDLHFALRLLMWPRGEVILEFDAMDAAWAPLSDRGPRAAAVLTRK